MKKNIIGLAVAATLGLVTLSAAAEDMYRGAWYLVPGASLIHPDSDLDTRNNGGGAFIRLGKELSENWDIQVGGGYARAGEDTGLPGAGGRYKQTLLGVDALYMFSRDKFRPFLLAGIGAARNNVDYSNVGITDGQKTSLMGNVGLGMQYLFTDNIGVQADLREVWSRAEAKPTLFNKKTIGNTYLNVGAIFRFGAPAPVVASEPEPAPMAEPMPAPVAAEPEPMPAAPACVPTMETVTISAEKLFGFDKAKLQAGAKPILDEAAAKIKANPAIELVMVTGYTDRIGSEAYNHKLSHQRAETVKNYLVSQGVEASRLEAVGKGEEDPVVTCSDKKRSKLIECLAPNRRVVISAQKEMESGCK